LKKSDFALDWTARQAETYAMGPSLKLGKLGVNSPLRGEKAGGI